MSNILVLTGCDRAMDEIGSLTAGNHRAYALRHGYQFERFTDYPSDVHPSWQKLLLVKERLKNYDAILWLDADTIITNPTQSLCDIVGDRKGLIVSKDWTEPLPEDEIKHFSLGNFVVTNDAGTHKLLELAAMRTEWANCALWEQQAIQEEYRENEAIREWVHILRRRALNAVPATPSTTSSEPWEERDFLCHMTFIPNAERAAMFWQKDLTGVRTLVPDLPAHHEQVMCADIRHIACIAEVMNCGLVRSALEIGVWTGAMTSGFFPALRCGALARLVCCDIQFQQAFRDVVSAMPCIELDERNSHVVLSTRGSEFDCVIVDGCHELDCVREEVRLLLRHMPDIIIAHDITATLCGFGWCEGAMYLHNALQSAGYICQIDCRRRDGEKTERGLLLASRCPETVKIINRCLAMTCY